MCSCLPMVEIWATLYRYGTKLLLILVVEFTEQLQFSPRIGFCLYSYRVWFNLFCAGSQSLCRAQEVHNPEQKADASSFSQRFSPGSEVQQDHKVSAPRILRTAGTQDKQNRKGRDKVPRPWVHVQRFSRSFTLLSLLPKGFEKWYYSVYNKKMLHREYQTLFLANSIGFEALLKGRWAACLFRAMMILWASDFFVASPGHLRFFRKFTPRFGVERETFLAAYMKYFLWGKIGTPWSTVKYMINFIL